MTEKECLGIDCLWCLNPDCPNERKNMKTKELEQKIKDQEIYIVGLKYQIDSLKHKLENFESYQREQCCECCQKAVVDYSEKEMELFNIKQKLKELSE